MSRYYKPKPKELAIGLGIEFYADGKWHPHVVEHLRGWETYLANDDIRVKYVDSLDFNTLGYNVKKTFLGKQTQIKDILPDNTEITEEIDIFDEEILTILKQGVAKGSFLPYAPNQNYSYNIEYQGNRQVVRNLYELRKILK